MGPIWLFTLFRGGRAAVFGTGQFLDAMSVFLIKDGRYLVFLSPNGNGKMQFLIENDTVMVLIQKFDYGTTIIFEEINGNTGI